MESLLSTLNDETVKSRVLDKKEVLACIWQIFHPDDAQKLREFLKKHKPEE